MNAGFALALAPLASTRATVQGRARYSGDWPARLPDAIDRGALVEAEAHLHVAGVERADLFVTDATRKAITFP